MKQTRLDSEPAGNFFACARYRCWRKIFRTMGTRDKRIDAYIGKSAEFAQPILRYLREIVHEGCPEVQETIKWSFPNFEHKGIICGMAAFKEHCSFGFWKGSLVVAGDDGKSADAMGQ